MRFAALCAANYVIIPLVAGDWRTQGIVKVMGAVEHVRDRYDPNLALLGYLGSRFNRARLYERRYLKKSREHFGQLAFDAVIPDLAEYEKSVAHGIPATLHAPAGIQARSARRFFAEVEWRIHRAVRGSPRCTRLQVRSALPVAA